MGGPGSGEESEEGTVGGRELEAGKVRERHPAPPFGQAPRERRLVDPAEEREEDDRAVLVDVADRRGDRPRLDEGHADLLGELAEEGLEDILVGLALPAGKLVEAGEVAAGLAAADEDAAVLDDDRERDVLLEGRFLHGREFYRPGRVAYPGLTVLRIALALLALDLAVLAAWSGVGENGFIRLDDPAYVTENEMVQGGLTREGVAWAFETRHAGYWQPLTWLSLMLDCELFGLDAGAHHRTNVLLHVANVDLLFVALLGLTSARHPWRCLVAAGLFALHPQRVESVAWAAERKDVLSATFWMISMLGYAWYVRAPSPRRFGLAFLPFALGLAAKPMLVTLPCALLLLDVWPLGRGLNRATLLEKLPFFAVTAAIAVVTVSAQRSAGAIVGASDLTPGARVANGLVSYALYLKKAFWPADLAVFYPYRTPGTLEVATAAILVSAITAVALVRWRREPWLGTGWFWFLGVLFPVSGVLQAGDQGLADRFTYLPHVGLSVAATWTAAGLVRRRPVAAALSIAVLAALAARTRVEVGYWRTNESLFRRALEVTEGNHVALRMVGDELAGRGDLAAAEGCYREALRHEPLEHAARGNLGVVLARQGRHEEAVATQLQVLERFPADARACYHLGLSYQALGRLDEAIESQRRALAAEPLLQPAARALGDALLEARRYAQAAAAYAGAIELAPGDARSRRGLGEAYLRSGRRVQAVAVLREALRLDPADEATRRLLDEAGRE